MTKSLKDEEFRLWLLWGFAVLLYFFANLHSGLRRLMDGM